MRNEFFIFVVNDFITVSIMTNHPNTLQNVNYNNRRLLQLCSSPPLVSPNSYKELNQRTTTEVYYQQQDKMRIPLNIIKQALVTL